MAWPLTRYLLLGFTASSLPSPAHMSYEEKGNPFKASKYQMMQKIISTISHLLLPIITNQISYIELVVNQIDCGWRQSETLWVDNPELLILYKKLSIQPLIFSNCKSMSQYVKAFNLLLVGCFTRMWGILLGGCLTVKKL